MLRVKKQPARSITLPDEKLENLLIVISLEGQVEINPLEFFINTLHWKITWNPAT